MSANVQKQTILPAHKWQVSCLEFSYDGLYLASGGWDKMVLIWDLQTLDPAQKIGFHKQPVTCLSFQSSSPGLLASGSADQTVAIWNPVNGKLERSLQPHSNWVLSTSFSANGKLLASASWDKTISVCDVETGQVVSSLTGHTTGVWTCAFNPDDSSSSDTLCSGAEDGSLKVWDLRSKSVVMSLIGGHEDRIKCCSWSPSAQYVASSSADGKLALWEPRSGTALTRIKAYDDSANQIMFYPRSRDNSVPLLFSIGGRTCNIWHPFRKQNKQLLSVKLNSPGEEIQAFGISPDGSLLATGGSDKAISLSTVDISLDQIDALPVETADKTNRGTLLWKKYTRKVIDHKINTIGRPSVTSPTNDPVRKTSESVIGMTPNRNGYEDSHYTEKVQIPKHNPAVRKTSGSLVGMAVHKQEIEEKHHVERAKTPLQHSTENLHAEPEVVFLHQRQKLRPKSENLSDSRKPEEVLLVQSELQSARQHLRKVRRYSNGSEVSSGSGPETNGHDYGAFAKVNGWNGIANGTHQSGYNSSSADDQTVIVNIDSENEGLNGSHHTNGYNSRGVNVQPSSRYQHFNISNVPNGNHQIHSPDDGESTSVSSSSYYADIDDVAQEMMDLTRQIEDHRL